MRESNECIVLSDSKPLTMPPRSPLYRLAPFKPDSTERESLSSYFCRIADAHCISPFQLAESLVVPGIGGLGDKSSRNFWREPYFNGIGEVCRTWSSVLGELTAVQGLERLTMQGLAEAVNTTGLMTKTKKWCPLCLEEEPYGKLLWELEVVTACPTHNVKLVESCGCASVGHNQFHAKFLPHICKYCGDHLSRSSPSTQAADLAALEVAQLVSQFLGSDYFNGPSKQSNFAKFLSDTIEQRFEGKAAWFASAIGVGKSVLHGWMNAGRAPSFARVVQIAQALECPLCDIFEGNAPQDSRLMNSTPRPSGGNCRQKKVNRVAIRGRLERFLALEEPVSVIEASRRLGVSKKYLYLHYNSLARELAARRIKFLAEQAEAGLREREVLYRAEARRLIAEGLIPTRRHLMATLGSAGQMFRREDKLLCNRILAEERKMAELGPAIS